MFERKFLIFFQRAILESRIAKLLRTRTDVIQINTNSTYVSPTVTNVSQVIFKPNSKIVKNEIDS